MCTGHSRGTPRVQIGEETPSGCPLRLRRRWPTSFDFSGVNGSDATLDFLYLGDSTVYSGTAASGSLYANQPMEVDILGLHSQAPAYLYPSNGPVVVLAECPDANTCFAGPGAIDLLGAGRRALVVVV